MFSSQFNESSYAEKNLSYFTESFANAIVLNEIDTIRYRDILDYISDDFSQKNLQQTPYYIFQGTNTEIFAHLNADIKGELKEKIFVDDIVDNPNEDEKEVSLINKIIEDAKLYCTSSEEVKDVFVFMQEYVGEGNEFTDLLNIYEYEAEFLDRYYSTVSNIDTVAKVINEYSEDFFVNMRYTTKTVKIPVKSSSLVALTLGHDEQKYREEQKSFLSYYEISEQKIPYNYIDVDLNPKYPNLSKYNCGFIFAFSKKEIMIFHSYSRYKEVRWGEYIVEDLNWRKSNIISLKNKDAIKHNLSGILKGFNDYVENDLKNHFKINAEKPGIVSNEK